MVRTVRKVLIYIVLVVVFIGVVGSLSIAVKLKTSDIKALKLEIAAKDEKINTFQTELEKLKKDMENDRKASQIHVEKIIEAGGEYAEKIEAVQSDDSAIDWLNQPLPDAVMYNYNKRICKNTDD